jgi:1,4-alpha-glucan branching enzyme
VLEGRSGDPFAVLGPARLSDGRTRVLVFQPGAGAVELLPEHGPPVPCRRLHPAGLFGGALPAGGDGTARYRLGIDWPHGRAVQDDPYRFPPVLGELDLYLFGRGEHRELYRRMGAHPMELEGVAGVGFAVWAPNARRVSVVGDFNDWDGRRHPMRLHPGTGVWDLFVPGLARGRAYKFELLDRDGRLLPLKADPFAFRAEHPPATASIVEGLLQHDWQDGAWLAARAAGDPRRRPMSVYECHLGSWRRDGPDGRPLTYRALADELVPYVADMGFTGIELLPITEFPYDGSWGYQTLSLFAPTSRYGTPEDFAAFVEAAHAAGLAVLLDWVPGHFPEDAHGLARFDGTHLYEHADPRQGRHEGWGTLIYNYGRAEVADFLEASARYWLDRYHLDGLRVDAVASMLYLDYDRGPGQWLPNAHGGNENLEAIAFLRRVNEAVYHEFEGAVTIAEESTAWPAVSRPTYAGGLGFGFKWNMGWMHDTLAYMARDPVHRRWHHGEITFGLHYAFSENFMLPLSHDEVVHGKRSLIGRMPGDRWQRFANLRAYYGLMWAHPGKKLLFMGGEIAQEREWAYAGSVDWHLLDQPEHAGVQRLVRDLNRLYRSTPALYERDCEAEGFQWVEGNDSERCVFAWLRFGEDREQPVLAVFNMTPQPHHGYRLGVPGPGRWTERLNTDSAFYGGSNLGNGGGVLAEPVPSHGHAWSVSLTLPPLAALMLLREP